MNNFNMLMNSINEISNIEFMVSSEQGQLYVSDKFVFDDCNDKISEYFFSSMQKYKITIYKEDERALALIIHFIKDSLIKVNNNKDKMILDILEGKEISKKEIISHYPFLNKKNNIIVIYTERNLQEVFELVETIYKDVQTIRLIYNNKIVIIGKLDDVKEHAYSLQDSLTCDISTKCIISYSSIDNFSDIKDIFDLCSRKIQIALKLNASKQVIGNKDLIFEETIDSISIQERKRLIKEFSKGFSKMDSDILNTVDAFFKCGLNLSEASKELYIHRNTLIYRLDKIYKETGFDLRNFNDAVIFKIIFLIWKQINN